jgi:hypothetical protein
MIIRAVYTNVGMVLSLFLYHSCIYIKGFTNFYINRVHVFDGIYDFDTYIYTFIPTAKSL